MDETLPQAQRRKQRPRLAPAGLRRDDAAAYCGLSVAAWDRLTAAGKTPRPVRLGGCLLWRRRELREWLDADCPDREEWNAIRAARRADN